MMAALGLLKRYGIESSLGLLKGPVAVVLLTAVLLILSSRIRFLHSAVLWISDRLIVFLFILLPLFVTLSVYVIFRNIV
jgi:hypothetical protein